MNPAMVSQNTLVAWAREMGYQLEDGSFPCATHFTSACNTKERRRLWDVIFKNVKDRRLIQKWSGQSRTDDKLQHSINSVDIEINRIDEEIARQVARIKEKTNKLAKIEEDTSEIQVKAHLLRRVSAKNTAKAQTYRENGLQIQHNICSDTPSNDVQLWLNSVCDDIRIRLADPSLVKELSAKMEHDCVSCNEVWAATVRRQQQLLHESLKIFSNTKDIHQEKNRSNIDETCSYWKEHIAKLEEDCLKITALTLLIKGDTIRKRAFQCGNSSIATIEADTSRVLASIQDRDTSKLSEDELNKLRRKLNDSQITYKHLKASVSDLWKRCESAVEELRRLSSRVRCAVSETSHRACHDAPRSRQLLQQRAHHTQNHSDFLISKPIFQIRLACGSHQPILPEITEDILVPKPVFEWKCYGKFEEFSVLVQEIHDFEDIKLENRRGKKLMRQLRSGYDRLEVISAQNANIDRIINISKNAPFEDMVPESHTLNGMTIKDWKLQFSLCSIPRHDFTTTSQF